MSIPVKVPYSPKAFSYGKFKIVANLIIFLLVTTPGCAALNESRNNNFNEIVKRTHELKDCMDLGLNEYKSTDEKFIKFRDSKSTESYMFEATRLSEKHESLEDLMKNKGGLFSEIKDGPSKVESSFAEKKSIWNILKSTEKQQNVDTF